MSNEAKIILSAKDATAAAFASISRNFDGLQNQAGRLETRFVALASALAVPLSGGAVAALVMEASRAVDEFNDLADATGASVENISALDRIARETGGDFSTVSTALAKFNQVLAGTDEEGSKAAAILQRMGLDVKALRAEDPAEALRQVAVAMGQFADDGAKGRVYFELFGKSAREMAPFMKDLAEQTSLQAKVSTEAAAQAEAFNKAISSLRANAQDAARSMTLALLPSLIEISNEMLAGMKHANGFIDAILTFGTINPFRSQQENIAKFRDELQGLQKDRERYVKSNSDTRGIDDAIRTVERQLNYLKDVQARNIMSSMIGQDTGDALSRRLSPRVSIGDVKKPSTGTPKDPLAEAKRYLESLQKQLEKAQELTAEEQALRDIQMGRLGTVTPELEKEIAATARLVDLLKAQKDSEKAMSEAAKRAAEAAGKLVDEASSFARSLETPWEKLQRSLNEIEQLGMRNPLINGEDLARANTRAWQEYLQTLETTAQQAAQVSEEARMFAGEVSYALGDGLASALDGDFRGIGDAFGRMIKRMTLQAASAQLNKYLFGDMFTGGSNLGALGGWIGGMFPTAWPSYDMYGGITGAGNSALMSYYGNGVGSFAVGTDFVPRDMLAMVHKGERIIPAHQNTGDAGTTYINLTVGDVASMAQVRRAVEEGVAAAKVQTVSGLNRSRTYGGVLA